MLSGSDEGTIKLWDVATGELLRSIERHNGEDVRSVAFSPDGTRVLSGDWLGKVRLWNPATGELLRTLGEDMRAQNESVAFSPDGGRVLSGGWSQIDAVGCRNG